MIRARALAARYRMHAYYVGTMIVGVLGIATTQWGWMYGVGMLVIGAMLLRQRCISDAHTEARLMRVLTMLVVAQAAVVITEIPTVAALVVVLRLVYAPLQMWDWAHYREGDAKLEALCERLHRD